MRAHSGGERGVSVPAYNGVNVQAQRPLARLHVARRKRYASNIPSKRMLLR